MTYNKIITKTATKSVKTLTDISIRIRRTNKRGTD